MYIKVFLKKILTRLGLRDKQSCKCCGINQHVVWKCKDKIWQQLPEKWHNKALCLECFIKHHPGGISVTDIKIIGLV